MIFDENGNILPVHKERVYQKLKTYARQQYISGMWPRDRALAFWISTKPKTEELEKLFVPIEVEEYDCNDKLSMLMKAERMKRSRVPEVA